MSDVRSSLSNVHGDLAAQVSRQKYTQAKAEQAADAVRDIELRHQCMSQLNSQEIARVMAEISSLRKELVGMIQDTKRRHSDKIHDNSSYADNKEDGPSFANLKRRWALRGHQSGNEDINPVDLSMDSDTWAQRATIPADLIGELQSAALSSST
eukprot:m.313365 g.313365  ORF g.313365 m.313365 type:complete len:154 (+) comp16408_c1_seq8:935-1396(+)